MKNTNALTLLNANSLSSACPVDSNAQYVPSKSMTKDFELKLNINTMLSSITEAEYNEAFNKIRGHF